MKLNSQPIEKQIGGVVNELDISEIFYTIQGEGPFAGEPAVFVRLAGCNLQCPGCDTNYTSHRIKLTIKQIVNRIIEERGTCKCDLVVVTGGEPFRQNFGALVKSLVSKDFRVQVETNGTLGLDNFPYDLTTIVCSPKTGKINPKLLPHISAFKYVLHHEAVSDEDGLPLTVLYHPSKKVARPPNSFIGEVYVQPMDNRDNTINQLNLRATINSAMKYGYKLCIQVHKIVGLE